MPDVIEIQVERIPSIECLRKLVELIEDLIRRLEAGASREPIVVRDLEISNWVRQSKDWVEREKPCTTWVCAGCFLGRLPLPESRVELLEKLTHFLKVLDRELPPRP